jgi:hypothetical protein
MTVGRVALVESGLGMGMTRRAAAAHAGIHFDTFYEWLKNRDPLPWPDLLAEPGDSPPTFSDIVTRGEGKAEAMMLTRVYEEAHDGTRPQSWQAAAWWLERRRQADFALKRGDLIQGADGSASTFHEVTDGLDDDARVLLRKEIDRVIATRKGDPGSSEGDPG